MSTLSNIDELESEILYLREQNQRILRELSKIIEENTALREKLQVQVECLSEGYQTFGSEGVGESCTRRGNLTRGFIGMSTLLN